MLLRIGASLTTASPTTRLRKALVAAPVAASVVVAALSLMILLEWGIVRSGLENRSLVMTPAAAVCFLCSCLSLFLLTPPVQRARNRLGLGLAVVVGVLGVTSLVKELAGLELPMAGWLFPSAESNQNNGLRASWTWMAPAASLNFILTSLALVGLARDNQTKAWLSQPIAMAIFMIALFGVLDYSYGAQEGIHLGRPAVMTLYTSFGFIALAFGVLCASPDRGALVILLSSTEGGGMARRLLLAAIVTPLALGWVIVTGQRALYYEPAFGTAMLVSACILVYLLVVWNNAESLHYMDLKREQAENSLREAHDELEMRVAARTAELAKTNQDLEREIRERTRVEQEHSKLLLREQAMRVEAEATAGVLRELRVGENQARLQAEAANRMKDEFLATVSHELRSPLHVILGWIQMMRQGKLDQDHLNQAILTIERSGRAQDRIIGDLLDVSKIITGRLRLNVQPMELAPVIETVVESLQPASEAKGVSLQIALDPNVGPISGDFGRMQQIIWNLISNAIKFTRRGGRVQVRLQQKESQAVISVKDDGEGISSGFLPYVFDRFRQGDGSSTRKQGGLGLGLAIVRHLVELHGGMVMAESAGINCGSEFTIRLPLFNRRVETSTSLSTASTEDDSDFLATGPRLHGLRILVVDDAEDALSLVETILKQQHAEVQTAGSAREALALFEDWRPNILVSDIEMPVMDGYSLIHQIRALEDPQSRILPAIALTAYTRVEDRLRALSEGFQMHVSKPVHAAELVTVIASLCGRL
jgi:signal transduction histidine kinase